MKGFIFICGIDVEGNAEVVTIIQELYPEYIALSRSKAEVNAEWKKVITTLDDISLMYTYLERPEIPRVVKYKEKEYPAYWFIRNARVKSKEFGSLWETTKALGYFYEKYREIAGYYGIPFIDVREQAIKEEVEEIIKIVESKQYEEIALISANKLTFDFIKERDIEIQVINALTEDIVKSFPEKKFFDKDGEKLINIAQKDITFKKKLIARWLINNTSPIIDPESIIYQRENIKIIIKKQLYFALHFETKTNKTYKIISQNPYLNKVTIVPKVRDSIDMRVFMEMMWRNKLKHTYCSINNEGIIIADLVETKPIQIEIKKYCEDQPLYGIDESIVLSTGEYRSGPHISFKWQNTSAKGLIPYYHLLEDYSGKENSNTELKSSEISAEIIEGVIDVEAAKESTIRLYCTIQAYLRDMNLELNSITFSLDRTGYIFCSSFNLNEYKEETILKYFNDHRFIDTEIKDYNYYAYQSEVEYILADKRLKLAYNNIYQKIRYINLKRSVIFTLEICNNKPSLIRNGKREIHSEGDIQKALNYILIYPDVLVVDVDGANRKLIKDIGMDHYIFTANNIHTLEDAQDLLNSGIRNILVDSNADELVSKVPKDRLLMNFILDESNNILIPKDQSISKESIEERLKRFAKLGIKFIRLTFSKNKKSTESIPREQIRDLMRKVPKKIEKIVIGGELSRLEDLEFLWSFGRVVPEIGSAIWTNKELLGEIYVAMTRFDGNGLVPGVIQDIHGIVKGLFWLNAEALKRTCQTRLLHRYSRMFKKLMCKGESSGSFHNVKQISLDCDSDSLLITVETDKPLCHMESFSCYEVQTIIKTNLNYLIDHIKSKKTAISYSGKMQRNSGLTLAKLIEEYWEIICADTDSKKLECADMLVHYLMYLNSLDISFDDILNELNTRRYSPSIIVTRTSKRRKFEDKIIIGIALHNTNKFIKDELGLEIVNTKLFRIEYEVIDKEKYAKFFGLKTLVIVPMRVEDMSMLVGIVDYVVGYDQDIKNGPLEYTSCVEMCDKSLRLVLLKKKGEEIDVSKWSKKYKAVIASQYPREITEFFRNKKVDEDAFTLVKTSGMNETYLINETKTNFILCDKVLGEEETANDLEVWKVIRDHANIGLYQIIVK